MGEGYGISVVMMEKTAIQDWIETFELGKDHGRKLEKTCC